MPEATIAAGFARAFLEFAASRGADEPTLVHRADLDAFDLADSERRLPFSRYIRLMQAAIELCQQPALALQFGEAVRLEEISILGHVGHQETAGDALAQANRFGRLAVDDPADGSACVEFVPEGSGVWLTFGGELYRKHRLFTESTLARCVCDGRAFAVRHPDKPWPAPKAISVTYPAPPYRDEYERIFRLPLFFSASRNGIMFDRELLSARVAPPNRHVSGLVQREAEALLKNQERASTTRGQVEGCLVALLPKGSADIGSVARELGLSRQTLFRRLREEGTTFEDVLGDIRRRLAVKYLEENELSVSQIAYLVGFSDPSAFSRAFKRWTGASPRQSKRR